MNDSMNKEFTGGLLLTGILFVFLFSFILSITLAEFKETQQFTTATIDYYKARIMTAFLLKNIPRHQMMVGSKGQVIYSDGKLSYIIQKDQVIVQVIVGSRTYHFNDAYQLD